MSAALLRRSPRERCGSAPPLPPRSRSVPARPERSWRGQRAPRANHRGQGAARSGHAAQPVSPGPGAVPSRIPGLRHGVQQQSLRKPQNPAGDWTATVNAGTKLIVPFGPKFFFLGDVFPGYTWYADTSRPEHLLRNGGSFDRGYFNRLSFEVGGRGSQSVTTHTEQPTPSLSQERSRHLGESMSI